MEHMSIEFEMSLVGELPYFLGLQVRKTISGTFVSQAKYAKNLVNKFKFDSEKNRKTSIGTHENIIGDEASNGVDQTLYRSMIGSLMYLIGSRPDLCYSVGVYVRYQASPKESHLLAIKKIIKYVSEIAKYGLWYTHDTTAILVGYCDVDWARKSKDGKSTSRGCFFLGNNLVSWFNKKQNYISLSIFEGRVYSTR